MLICVYLPSLGTWLSSPLQLLPLFSTSLWHSKSLAVSTAVKNDKSSSTTQQLFSQPSSWGSVAQDASTFPRGRALSNCLYDVCPRSAYMWMWVGYRKWLVQPSPSIFFHVATCHSGEASLQLPSHLSCCCISNSWGHGFWRDSLHC